MSSARRSPSLPPASRPLAGMRVLELAEGWAGPMTGMWLGDLGAEVIKVEAIQRYDHTRGPIAPAEGLPTYPRTRVSRPYDVSAPFVEGNRNKLSVTIDLSRPTGVALFKRLVALSDIVVTNMVTGVPEKMGIGYDVLREVRPDLIMLFSSGYGATGPYAKRVTMGGAMDGIAGYMWLRHYPDETPDTNTYSTETDVVTGLNNAMAVQMAVYHRLCTGRGQVIETAGVEASIQQISGALMDYAMNGRVQASVGNGHSFMAPHGCYPCAGDDRWIAIAAGTEEQWQALCRVLGDPPWTREPRFATVLGRMRHGNELDALLGQWTREWEHNDLMHRLQEAGVPAGAVHDHAEHAADPHWSARGVYQPAILGDGDTFPVPTSPWRFDGCHLDIWRAPPPFGRHNGPVLGELLGLTAPEMRRLRDEQYIGEEPLPGQM